MTLRFRKVPDFTEGWLHLLKKKGGKSKKELRPSNYPLRIQNARSLDPCSYYIRKVEMQPQHTIYYNLLIEAQEILEADRADIAALALFRNLKFITADALTGSGVRFPGFFARLD